MIRLNDQPNTIPGIPERRRNIRKKVKPKARTICPGRASRHSVWH